MNDFQEQPYYSNKPETDDFEPELDLRKGFIRKVYGVLFCQLAVTFIFITFGTLVVSQSTLENLLSYYALSIIAGIVLFVVTILLCCVKSLARTVPINYILLSIFTLCESYLLMLVAAGTDPHIVFSAAAITVACTLGLTAYAWTTKKDFTLWVGFMWAILFTFAISGILLIFFRELYIFYCFGGVVIYSIYLIIDTQLILGKFENEFSSEDYVIAAMNLYIDIIQLFLYILRILSKSS